MRDINVLARVGQQTVNPTLVVFPTSEHSCSVVFVEGYAIDLFDVDAQTKVQKPAEQVLDILGKHSESMLLIRKAELADGSVVPSAELIATFNETRRAVSQMLGFDIQGDLPEDFEYPNAWYGVEAYQEYMDTAFSTLDELLVNPKEVMALSLVEYVTFIQQGKLSFEVNGGHATTNVMSNYLMLQRNTPRPIAAALLPVQAQLYMLVQDAVAHMFSQEDRQGTEYVYAIPQLANNTKYALRELIVAVIDFLGLEEADPLLVNLMYADIVKTECYALLAYYSIDDVSVVGLEDDPILEMTELDSRWPKMGECIAEVLHYNYNMPMMGAPIDAGEAYPEYMLNLLQYVKSQTGLEESMQKLRNDLMFPQSNMHGQVTIDMAVRTSVELGKSQTVFSPFALSAFLCINGYEKLDEFTLNGFVEEYALLEMVDFSYPQYPQLKAILELQESSSFGEADDVEHLVGCLLGSLELDKSPFIESTLGVMSYFSGEDDPEEYFTQEHADKECMENFMHESGLGEDVIDDEDLDDDEEDGDLDESEGESDPEEFKH